MTITVALVAVAVLGAIVVVAVGGGGQLSTEHPDHPPLALPGGRAVGGTDAVLLRLPLGLWGYHKQITDEALQRFADELTERETRIAVLEQELAEARQGRDGDTRPDLRPERHVGRHAALPPARNDTPDPMVTRTDIRPGLSVSGQEPPATHTDVPSEGPTRIGDPWKTIVDRPADAEEEADPVEERPSEPVGSSVEESAERPVGHAASSERVGSSTKEPGEASQERRVETAVSSGQAEAPAEEQDEPEEPVARKDDGE
ncbi:hypothetical protein [Actinoallomurus acaciae]|uniref:DivIVA domain-containing protein n=1 Tax=Actinoallomurus acaciae TaxID=502577 RepID=A0ABV5YAP0_9ACTN